jgi:hypothetical protein
MLENGKNQRLAEMPAKIRKNQNFAIEWGGNLQLHNWIPVKILFCDAKKNCKKN